MSDGPDFAIHSWGDVMAVLSVTGALIGGIIWGLKLENRIDLLRERMHNLELSRQQKKRLLEDEP
jgi:hypothetical protein